MTYILAIVLLLASRSIFKLAHRIDGTRREYLVMGIASSVYAFGAIISYAALGVWGVVLYVSTDAALSFIKTRA